MGTAGAVSKKLGPMMKAARFGDVYQLIARPKTPRTLAMFVALERSRGAFTLNPVWIGIRLDRPGQVEDFLDLDYRHTWEKVSDAAD
jgi:hypothetical protein